MKFFISRIRDSFDARTTAVIAGAVGIVCVILFAVHHHAAKVAGGNLTAELPTVAVAKVDRQDLFNEVTIPAEFRP